MNNWKRNVLKTAGMILVEAIVKEMPNSTGRNNRTKNNKPIIYKNCGVIAVFFFSKFNNNCTRSNINKHWIKVAITEE
ncbi:hypothetical protein LQF60_08895 [Tetragenococcus koreensis]|uniref:hypothetical protein n=1 Tax=Tetragenococcus koreensis TaxID=290335 RepID=UPI001F4775BB|nr:hypothetical protein [Tetragenococcus koreensis]MCF1629950.1 hypothetical protein [Tetragenococcus koreensis]